MTRENAELPASPRAVRQVTDSPMGRGPNERPLGLISTLHAERDQRLDQGRFVRADVRD